MKNESACDFAQYPHPCSAREAGWRLVGAVEVPVDLLLGAVVAVLLGLLLVAAGTALLGLLPVAAATVSLGLPLAVAGEATWRTGSGGSTTVALGALGREYTSKSDSSSLATGSGLGRSSGRESSDTLWFSVGEDADETGSIALDSANSVIAAGDRRDLSACVFGPAVTTTPTTMKNATTAANHPPTGLVTMRESAFKMPALGSPLANAATA